MTTYDLILADPPWRYSFSRSKSRRIENQYPTMSDGEILAFNIPAKQNSVLYLWATAPKLELALQVMKAWGFNYKTHAVWDKRRDGQGYWFRGRHELLLVGTRGKFSPPAPKDRHSSVIEELRDNQHSRKPDLVYEILEKAFPKAKKIELFARRSRPGWDAQGNQMPFKGLLKMSESEEYRRWVEEATKDCY